MLDWCWSCVNPNLYRFDSGRNWRLLDGRQWQSGRALFRASCQGTVMTSEALLGSSACFRFLGSCGSCGSLNA
eukprot:scaffold2446_cov115-Pinguiococcus_pyrenoidosus.AAC.1